MSMTPAWSQPMGTNVPMTPVVLPLGNRRDPVGKALPDSGGSGARRMAKAMQFAFPAIPSRHEELPGDDLPRAVWPSCDCTEAVQACIRLAKNVRSRLPVGRPSVVGLTSPGDGAGKTTLMATLAPELAKRTPGGVLAVDADFHKADLTSWLAVSEGGGPIGAPQVYATDRVGLSVLPMSLERESQGGDGAWIGPIRQNWPLAILDMASLEHSETAPLLRHCDGVCLVVRLGHTARRAVAEAARVIAANRGLLLGCVVVG